MMPSIEIRPIPNQVRTIQDYAELDTEEFNDKADEAVEAIKDMRKMLKENGE